MANASGIITTAARNTSIAELMTLFLIRSDTGSPVASDVPRSPCSRPPSQSKYRLTSDASEFSSASSSATRPGLAL
jgi:hypothetical protein